VPVRFTAGEDSETVLRRARDAVNASSTCISSKVQAVLETGTHYGSEDEFRPPPRLRFQASGARGRQLIAALHAGPGQATGAGLEVGGLGIPVLNQFQVTKVSLETPASGAAGGRVTLVEHSDLGVCALTVTTAAGQSAAQIAAALEAAAQAPGIPGPHPGCPSENNPRDLVVRDGALISAAAYKIEIASEDRNVGVDLRPADLDHVHPSADAGKDRVIPDEGQGRISVSLDASASTDADSTPGTHDHIVAFEWFEVSGENLRPLGSGERINVTLERGAHRIRLRIWDKVGLEDTAEALITVEGGSKGSQSERQGERSGPTEPRAVLP